jgi:hypothetical protein
MARTLISETIDGFRVSLTNTGKLYVAYGSSPPVLRRWYENPVSRVPWIPKKRNFVALMRMRIRNGDFDDIKNPSQPKAGIVDGLPGPLPYAQPALT